MSHIRTQVRDAVIARLTPISALSSVVPYGRTVKGFQVRELPAAVVRVSDSASTATKVRPRVQQRSVDVAIDIVAPADGMDVDMVLDDLAVDVEKVLSADGGIGVPMTSWDYVSTVGGDIESGDQPLAAIRITYRGSISTKENDPTVNIHGV